MKWLHVDEPTVDGDLAVATLHAEDFLVGPAGVLQGGVAAASLELASRAVSEVMGGLGPGDPRVAAPTMITTRLHQPTPVGADVAALVERVDDVTFWVRTVVGDQAETADFGDQDEVGGDVLVSGEVELAGHGPQPTLDDMVALALVDQMPAPVDVPMAPTCWVCGRDHDGGLHLYPGWVDGAHVVEEWTPDERVAGDVGGFVDPAAVAAVLDCPTAFACRDHMAAEGFGGALLGGYTVAWFSRVPLGERLRIAARMDHAEGRKMRATSVLVGADGHVHAAASAFQVGVAAMAGGDAEPLPAYGTGDW